MSIRRAHADDAAAIGPSRRRDVAETEIWVIHVLPTSRRRGMASALWAAVCCELRGPELASMHVDTLAELDCCRFYEARGGERCEERPTAFHGAARTHVTYRWPRGRHQS